MENLTKAPLAVLDVIRPFIERKSDIFERVPIEKGYLKFQGKGICKDFFFSFNHHEVKGAELNMYLTICPYNKHVPGSKDVWIPVRNLNTVFDQWISALKSYHEHSIAFGSFDQETKLAEEIYTQFEPIDELDADSISINDLVRIDENLENLKGWIEDQKTLFLPQLYEEIHEEINLVQGNLTGSTKSELARRIAKILAKITKNGPRLLKETTVEILKATVAEVVKTNLLGM